MIYVTNYLLQGLFMLKDDNNYYYTYLISGTYELERSLANFSKQHTTRAFCKIEINEKTNAWYHAKK